MGPLWFYRYCRSSPREYSNFDKRTGKTDIHYQFATFTHPYFSELHLEWYSKVEGKNVKGLPANISELLTPRAFAYWLTGDGSYHKRDNCIHIYTNSFTKAEVELWITILHFHISSTINIQRNSKGIEQSIIRIPKREVSKVKALVSVHMPPSMRYRVGLPSSS
jgi:hypothetical protein